MTVRSSAFLALALLLAGPLAAPSSRAADWQLVWSDEFDGSTLDLSRWSPQIGTGCPSLCGWGNNELQYYRAENATVSGGMLTIEARQESFGGRSYTSARLRTRNLGDFLYGRMEMRAKLPTGKGLWPAFWMLPTDNVYGGWAASGEIDIMEVLGSEPAKLYGTIHFGDSFPGNAYAGQTTTLSSGDFNSDFHEFALEWEPTELRWYLDGVLFATQTNWFSAGQPFPAPFDERFHLLLNVAVGGNFPGNPDGSTVFPQQMIVDYVRVYEDQNTCEVVYAGMDHAAPFANGWFSFNGGVGGGGIGGNTTDLPPVGGGTGSLDSGWGSGGVPGFVGGFGRSRDLDLSGFTHFEFWIRPDAGQSYTLEVNLQEDDNGDGVISGGADDEFQAIVEVGPAGADAIAGGGWQKLSIPLQDFADDNSFYSGGNGILDAVAVGAGGNGMLGNVVIALLSQDGTEISFRTDRWAFTRRDASVTGRVWEDTDGNGLIDPGEPGVASVDLELRDGSGNLLGATTTAPDGIYQFSGLAPDSYEVLVIPASLPEGVAPTWDPDGIVTPDRFVTSPECSATVSDGDFGYRQLSTGSPVASLRGDRLHAASPNPFNARTVLRFDLASASSIELAVFDAQGRLVRTLEAGEWAAGSHQSIWDGTDQTGRIVASGVYFASLQSARGRLVTRMVLLK